MTEVVIELVIGVKGSTALRSLRGVVVPDSSKLNGSSSACSCFLEARLNRSSKGEEGFGFGCCWLLLVAGVFCCDEKKRASLSCC